jgi:hypothetical protein
MLVVYIRFQEVIVSNSDQLVGYHDGSSCGFPSSFQVNFGIAPSNRSMTTPLHTSGHQPDETVMTHTLCNDAPSTKYLYNVEWKDGQSELGRMWKEIVIMSIFRYYPSI